MFYYKFTASTPYCGTELVEYHKFETEPNDEMLECIAEQIARENGESYEYLLTGWDDENIEDLSEGEIEEMLNNYYADCHCKYVKVTKEQYDEEG